MSLTEDGKSGVRNLIRLNLSRKIYHPEKANSSCVAHGFIINKQAKRKIQNFRHIQGKQSKPETHKYFKRGSFSKNLAEIKCL